LIKTTRQFKAVSKDRLFYNRFEYVIGFTLDEASCLRDLSHEEIDHTIERRKEWRSIAMQRWHKTGQILGRQHILGRRRKDITDETVENLHSLAEILSTTSIDYKLVVTSNQGHVYTNDLALIDQLADLDYLEKKSYSRADISRPQNTIQLKDPKHGFRSYFKIAKLTDDQKRNIINFLDNQRESIRISPALERWLTTPLTRTQDYFFIDHNEMSWLTMMALVRPGIIRKTQQIIQAK
jgi:hypothetical protein